MAHDEQFDEWELGSGLPLDGARVRVIGSEFGIDTGYSADAVCWKPTFANVEDGDTQQQLYSCGKGWEIREKGARIEGGKKINDQSGYGRWIKAAMELEGVLDFLRGRGSPRSAATWDDTEWTLGTITIEVVNPTTKEKKQRSVIVPVEFHGASEAPAAAPAKTSKGKAEAKAAPAPSTDLSDELKNVLLAIATKVRAKGGDHAAFVDAALDNDEVAASRAAIKAAQADGDGSVWAESGE